MKNKNSILFYPLIIMEVLLTLTSCKKDDNKSARNPINDNFYAAFNTS